MKYRFYKTTETAWKAMYEAIQAAHDSIYLETYVFRNDIPGLDFLEILRKKARAGVRVTMLVDGIGSIFFSLADQQKLEEAGGEVEFSFNILHRIHRKLLIIDEKVAFLGGVNFGKRFRGWSDLHVRLDGRVVRSITRSFAYSYRLAGGHNSNLLALAGETGFQKVRARLHEAKHSFLAHWPFKGRGILKLEYRRRIDSAKKKIIIVTPYFVPHGWLLRALFGAIRRDAQVQVIIPKRSDILVTSIANLSYARRLSPQGIQFFFTENLNHAKVLFVDDREGLVGSHNIDAMSFDFNYEVSLHFTRKDMAGDLRVILDEWRRNAVPFEDMQFSWKWYYAPIEWVIRFLQPVL